MGSGGNGSAGGKPPAERVSGGWRERRDRPLYSVALWPNRSLTPGMRKTVLGGVGAGLALPLVMLSGTPVFWGLAPFAAGTMALFWLGLRRNDRDGRLVEELTLWRDEVRVERREPSGRLLRWCAEPMGVRIRLHSEPVESYLTLDGGGREIELGAFLSPGEREALAGELEEALTRALRS